MRCLVLSLGGTTLCYGNVFNSSPRLGNFIAEYLCGYLRSHASHSIDISFHQENDSLSEIISTCKNYDVLFLALDLVNYETAKMLIEYIRNASNIITVLFGHTASSYYGEIIKDIRTNFIVIGDPEEPSMRLLNYLNDKNQIDILNDVNIASINSHQNKLKAICSDYNRWPCFDFYLDNGKKNKNKTHCISLKNNVCVCGCSFCWSNKGKYVFKDVNRIIDEIKYVATSFSVHDFYFTDNDILDYETIGQRQTLEILFTRIIDLHLNISIFVFSKARSINKNNLKILKLMKQAGVYCVFVGIDAGNKIDLKLYNKSSSLVDINECIKYLKKINLWYRIGFISINPYSTLTSLKQNFLFLKKIKSVNYYHFGNRLMLFQNTPIYFKIRNDNLLKESYSFLKYYDYFLVDKSVELIANFLQCEVYPALEKEIYAPYFALRKFYEMAKITCHINHDRKMISIEHKLRHIIYKYMKIIFIDNNINKARIQLDKFVNNVKNVSKDFNQMCLFYKKIYKDSNNVSKEV